MKMSMYNCHVSPSGCNPPMPSNPPMGAADAHMPTPDMPPMAPGLPGIGEIGRAGEASGTTGFSGIGSMGGPEFQKAKESLGEPN